MSDRESMHVHVLVHVIIAWGGVKGSVCVCVCDRESMHVHVHVRNYSVGWGERQCVCVCDRACMYM